MLTPTFPSPCPSPCPCPSNEDLSSRHGPCRRCGPLLFLVRVGSFRFLTSRSARHSAVDLAVARSSSGGGSGSGSAPTAAEEVVDGRRRRRGGGAARINSHIFARGCVVGLRAYSSMMRSKYNTSTPQKPRAPSLWVTSRPKIGNQAARAG